jgi:hypothetical protein
MRKTPGRTTDTTDLAVIASDYNWREAFTAASSPKRVEGATVDEAGFGVADVAHVYDADPGENDGPSWMIAGLLNDGRSFYIEAGCDYTGWDCRSWGTSWVANDLAGILRWGMTDEARERLPGVHAAVVGGAP